MNRGGNGAGSVLHYSFRLQHLQRGHVLSHPIHQGRIIESKSESHVPKNGGLIASRDKKHQRNNLHFYQVDADSDSCYGDTAGLNKPKCIQCGNVARSRCPFRSCKSCCSKAQNPCHIHVLKSNSAFPDKSKTSSTPSSDQKSTQSSSQVTSLRVPSYRQLSNAFAQFDNLLVRTKKHVTRKDAIALNEWRFSKLKEFKDRNIEIENNAFDRYMQNISLLEEVFSTETVDEGSELSPTSQEGETLVMTSGMKLRLRLNPVRTNNARKRIQQIVDQGIQKLQKSEPNDGSTDPNDQNKLDNMLKREKSLWVERSSRLSNIVNKLNKARNEEDIESCLEMKAQLYNQTTMSTPTEIKDVEALNEQGPKNNATPGQVANYPRRKLFTPIEIDQETLNKVDAHFSSLEQIEDL
ncbi:uncharacterized protein LOC120207931 [Hibiscus syriacus]|uniref:uncharacterized protein LOC120207931 n=1 Tax=Hibiscus syriacus TaxID=106335 RepID=UPI001920B484|nr:uncharacterized protein LOC120207931 [Hibiscus syriacus]